MSVFSPVLSADKETLAAYAGRMRRLYDRMAEAYNKAAACYGFSCNGCDENCCEERFYHHTLSEFLYLLKGIRSCDTGKRKEIFGRAREVAGLYAVHDREGRAQRVMCPLNTKGLCSLYDHRPMICRLHGVAYRMRRPDGTETQGIGCHKVRWDMLPEKNSECMLDRTDLYREMSVIEVELRRHLGFSHRVKMTIAEMVVDVEEVLMISESQQGGA